MTDSQRRNLEEKLSNGWYLSGSQEEVKAAIAEIDRLKSDNARLASNDQIESRRNEELREEIVKLKEDNEWLAAENGRLAARLIEATRIANNEIEATHESNVKLRNELSDANVQLEVYRRDSDSRKKRAGMTLDLAIGVLNKYEHRGYGNWKRNDWVLGTPGACSSVGYIITETRDANETISIANKYEADSDVLAITELHNRVAALEATLKNAKVMTHISSGKIYIEVGA